MRTLLLLFAVLTLLGAQESNITQEPVAAESTLGLNLTTDLGGLGIEVPLSPNDAVGGAVSYASSASLQNAMMHVIAASSYYYRFPEGVYHDGLYFGAYLAYASVGGTIALSKTSTLYTLNENALKMGALVGYRWMWEHFNISLDIGYGVLLGTYAAKMHTIYASILGESGASIIDLFLPMYSSLRLGWAF